jgi:elongation factor G
VVAPRPDRVFRMTPRPIRSFGIIAHINAGKTTLTERILFATGKQRFVGDVDSGTSAMDWMPEEQARGISIGASCSSVPWRGLLFQLIDTPGHVDFTAEVERSLRVLDGVVLVLDAGAGIEPQTEAVWRRAAAFGLPALVFVNKLDRTEPDWAALRDSLEELTGRRVEPVVEPLFADASERPELVGLRDLVGSRRLGDDGRGSWFADAAAARDALIERLTEVDDDLLTRCVEGEGVSGRELHAALRRQTIAGRVVPMFVGSALRDLGVELLLDGVARYLPSPDERPAPKALVVDAAGGFAGLVFKVVESAASVGEEPSSRLGQIRIFRGELREGDELEAGGRSRFRVQGLCRVHGPRREPLESAGAGEIVGLDLPSDVGTGATLREPGSSLMLEPVAFSLPVLTCTLEPELATDIPEVAAAARRLIVHDPTLRLDEDPHSGELRITGMGELQLAIFHERLQRLVRRSVRLGAQRVAAAETVAGAAIAEAELQRPLVPAAIEPGADAETRREDRPRVLRARVALAIAPSSQRGEARVVPSAELSEHPVRGLRAVLAGLRKQARNGFVQACPVRDVDIEVRDVGATIDGEPLAADDGVDPGDAAAAETLMLEAARLAARRAFDSAGHREMRPIMRFLVSCPHDMLRSVLADLRVRGARIDEVGGGIAGATVRGGASLERMLGYATDLRSRTRGKGMVTMVVDRFAVDPEAEE